MLLEPLITIWFSIIVCISITVARSESTINPNTEEDGVDNQDRKVHKRQVPWLLPQLFPNLIFLPNTREGWRYYPCRSYPTYPYPSPYPPPSLPPSTPPSSPADDPNEILDRMGGGGEERKKGKEEPSRCVWAIVACCSPGSRDIRYSCFELLGCPGAFWDVNPCDEKVVMAAANSALNFYSGMNNETSSSS
ncbi:hadley [Lycorma delicatula]|uniref:hadley n=1 Tax=Lycorma delicatula TaxID=130591 RepID=UPI003F51988F